jgi:FkbM family methyltransferase
MREILENNIKENKWTNIQVEPYALWNKDEQRIFVMPDDDSMAGHLEVSKDSRSLDDGNNHFEEVACVKLSHYLNQRIDFLKLDIEGSELEVLEESKELLGNVRYIFCEYHHDKEAPFLSKILQILEEKGFDVHVDKSHCFKVGTTYRPMTYLNNQQYKYSAVLYCVNKELM